MSRCLGSLQIGCWFTSHTFKSVFFIKEPRTSTQQSVDERDVIDVTDPVRSIAAEALANLAYKPQQKPNLPARLDEKKVVTAAVKVMQDLPHSEIPLSKRQLTQTITKTGNRTFFVDVNKE